jgi:guanosine-3',5'-bis(diphosphate) 3'-pyrophosphohydrolase
MIVRGVFGVSDETVLAAALLHDTIEDTTTDYDDLHEEFGKEIADIVATLSKDKRMQEEQREAEYSKSLAEASWPTRLIKLADTYDNLCDAATSTSDTKSLEKAEHALTFASSPEPEIQAAKQALEKLLQQFK